MFRQMEKEKREIRMEKIVNLLNEYEGQESWSYDKKYWIYIWWGDDLDYECFICSKKFWFIKWLVENEKIDFDNRDLKDKYMECFERYPYYPYTDFSLTWLIMLLSIQDEPIEFLVSILK